MTIVEAIIPRNGYHRRLAVYLREMFPVSKHLVMSVVLCSGFMTILVRAHGVSSWIPFEYLLLAIWNVFGLALILRLMDELKDRDIDLELFSHRPVPSGRVHLADIRFSLAVLCVIYVLPSLAHPETLVAAVVLIGYALLMFRYFYLPPSLTSKLLVNLATHNPIGIVLLLYLTVLFSQAASVPLDEVQWSETFPAVAMFWLPLLAWEISRKIRYDYEENEYVTYSRIMGRAGAVIVLTLIQTAAVGCGLVLARNLGSSWVMPGIVIVAYLIVLVVHFRFLVQKKLPSRRLRTTAELFAVTIMLAPLVELQAIGG